MSKPSPAGATYPAAVPRDNAGDTWPAGPPRLLADPRLALDNWRVSWPLIQPLAWRR